VFDALQGYVSLASELHACSLYSGAYNFGPSEADVLPVGRIADELCRLWGGGARWERDDGPRPHEAKLLTLDASHARTTFSLPPSLDHERTMKWTVEWYRAFHEGRDMRAFSDAQLTAYWERSSS
jgi:CDP-glucose 4,6-dehydratase